MRTDELEGDPTDDDELDESLRGIKPAEGHEAFPEYRGSLERDASGNIMTGAYIKQLGAFWVQRRDRRNKISLLECAVSLP